MFYIFTVKPNIKKILGFFIMHILNDCIKKVDGNGDILKNDFLNFAKKLLAFLKNGVNALK